MYIHVNWCLIKRIVIVRVRRKLIETSTNYTNSMAQDVNENKQKITISIS